ncbi:hypothetical protein [Umezawaea beigongshangensis]|uniref:hypothetical protein n=1 Tax=Umezawaea beigongshangensis TaxID=2780383 RepID=UPI0018F1284A|nr:hypothetical protein [Umezawaea beigongshangensis]
MAAPTGALAALADTLDAAHIALGQAVAVVPPPAADVAAAHRAIGDAYDAASTHAFHAGDRITGRALAAAAEHHHDRAYIWEGHAERAQRSGSGRG